MPDKYCTCGCTRGSHTLAGEFPCTRCDCPRFTLLLDGMPRPKPREPLREATDAEDRIIRYLSRLVGQALMRGWDETPPEFRAGTEGMTLSCCAALAHNLAHLLASAPTQGLPVDDAGWRRFIDTTVEMVRRQAIDVRAAMLEHAAHQRESGVVMPGIEMPPLLVVEPKFKM